MESARTRVALARMVRVVALASTKLVLSALRRSYPQLTHGYETEGAALRDEMLALLDHLRSADLREGLAALAAKRKPVFTGRWGRTNVGTATLCSSTKPFPSCSRPRDKGR